RHAAAQQPDLVALGERLWLTVAGGTNVVAFDSGDDLVLVDSGEPGRSDALLTSLHPVRAGARVGTVFNTHWHLEHTAGNSVLRQAGATIVAVLLLASWLSQRELAAMIALLEEALDAGALGLSTGLFTAPGSYAKPDEIMALCRVLKRYNAGYFTHLRDESSKVLEAQGAKLEPIDVPTPNYGYLDSIILSAEAGAAFEPDTLNSRIKELERQIRRKDKALAETPALRRRGRVGTGDGAGDRGARGCRGHGETIGIDVADRNHAREGSGDGGRCLQRQFLRREWAAEVEGRQIDGEGLVLQRA
ncbi:MBL fold metallo-hydrolase, partial [Lacticaseibacillus rhamnosus]